MARLTIEKANERLEFIGSSLRIINHGIIPSSTLNVVCECGSEFTMRWRDLSSGNTCRKCNDDVKRFTIHGVEEHKADAMERRCTIYVVKLYNDYEKFYKIGITTEGVSQRMLSIPYTDEVMFELEMSLYDAVYTEQSLLIGHNKYRYNPLINFAGYTECFSVIDKTMVNKIT